MLVIMDRKWGGVFRHIRGKSESTLVARIPETYQWLLVPLQSTPQRPINWDASRLSVPDALAVRVSKTLRSDELYLTSFGATRLRMELDRVRLWRGDHVEVKQLVEDFARYLYLPRLKEPSVLLHAMTGGINLLTWARESVAFADGYDGAAGRYQGLRARQMVTLLDSRASGVLVKPDVAMRQLDAEITDGAPDQVGAPGDRELPDAEVYDSGIRAGVANRPRYSS